MLETHTVTRSTVTVDRDDLGNTTESTSASSITGLLFAPEGLTESTDPDNPRVIGEATLYGTVSGRLNADDELTHASGCCDGSDFPHGSWQVVGGSKGWGNDDTAIPIRRTGAA